MFSAKLVEVVVVVCLRNRSRSLTDLRVSWDSPVSLASKDDRDKLGGRIDS